MVEAGTWMPTTRIAAVGRRLANTDRLGPGRCRDLGSEPEENDSERPNRTASARRTPPPPPQASRSRHRAPDPRRARRCLGCPAPRCGGPAGRAGGGAFQKSSVRPRPGPARPAGASARPRSGRDGAGRRRGPVRRQGLMCKPSACITSGPQAGEKTMLAHKKRHAKNAENAHTLPGRYASARQPYAGAAARPGGARKKSRRAPEARAAQ